MHRTSNRFWKCFNTLPSHIQRVAEESFRLLKENPRHPLLHFKKVGKLGSGRVSLNYRALAVEDNSDFIWVWVGGHDEYKQMIRGMG